MPKRRTSNSENTLFTKMTHLSLSQEQEVLVQPSSNLPNNLPAEITHSSPSQEQEVLVQKLRQMFDQQRKTIRNLRRENKKLKYENKQLTEDKDYFEGLSNEYVDDIFEKDDELFSMVEELESEQKERESIMERLGSVKRELMRFVHYTQQRDVEEALGKRPAITTTPIARNVKPFLITTFEPDTSGPGETFPPQRAEGDTPGVHMSALHP